MRRYETILITHVDLPEEEMVKLIDRYSAIITGQKGILIKVERWGKRRLAYLINKQIRGFYLLAEYAGESVVVNELERNLKIDDKILKFMTVLKESAVDADALQKEIEAAAAKTDAKEETKGTSAAAPPAAAQDASPAPEAAKTEPSLPADPQTDAKGGN